MFNIESWLAIFRDLSVFENGLMTTLTMALGGFIIALILGVIFGLMATGKFNFFRIISRIYVEFFQNTPLMLQGLFLFYAVTFSGYRSFTPLQAGIIILGLYHGAYISEVIRAGIEAIPYGQSEAAYAQGFTHLATMKYIIIPQTTRIILPPMVNQVVALIKNTSAMLLVGGAADLISTTNAYAVGSSTARYASAAYIFSGFLFFIVCFPLTLFASKWESRLKKREQFVVSGLLTTVPEISDETLDMLIEEEQTTRRNQNDE